VSQDTSRKRFLAKMLGFAAAGAVAPSAVARSVALATTNKEDGGSVAFRLSPDPRAVARARG